MKPWKSRLLTSLLLALLLLSVGCVHYLPRDGADGSQAEQTGEQTDGNATESTTVQDESESEPLFPNEPETDHTKRY